MTLKSYKQNKSYDFKVVNFFLIEVVKLFMILV